MTDRESLVQRAEQLRGVPYQWGDTTDERPFGERIQGWADGIAREAQRSDRDALIELILSTPTFSERVVNTPGDHWAAIAEADVIADAILAAGWVPPHQHKFDRWVSHDLVCECGVRGPIEMGGDL